MCQLVALVLRDLRVLVSRLAAAGGSLSPVAFGTRRRLLGVVEGSSSISSSLDTNSIISSALGVFVMRRVLARSCVSGGMATELRSENSSRAEAGV